MRKIIVSFFLLQVSALCFCYYFYGCYPSSLIYITGIRPSQANSAIIILDDCSEMDSLGVYLNPTIQAKFGDSEQDFLKFISQLDLSYDETFDHNCRELLIKVRLMVSDSGFATVLEVDGKRGHAYSNWELSLVKQFESSRMWRPAICHERNVDSYLNLSFRLLLH
jgi:hypothetical protein